MPYRQRYAKVKSVKHEVTWSNLAQNASTTQNITLVDGVAVADATSATDVIMGHGVKFLYLEFHFSAENIASPKVIHWVVEVIKGGQTTGNPNVYDLPYRAQIIQRGMEMLPRELGTVFKRIIAVRVPKHMQRITEETLIRFRYISSSTETINACGIGIYKEIY